jgi:hypothetical protein
LTRIILVGQLDSFAENWPHGESMFDSFLEESSLLSTAAAIRYNDKKTLMLCLSQRSYGNFNPIGPK